MIKYKNKALSVKGNTVDIMADLTAIITGIYEVFYEHNPATADMFKDYISDEDGLLTILNEVENRCRESKKETSQPDDDEKSIGEIFEEIDGLIKDIEDIIGNNKKTNKKEDK